LYVGTHAFTKNNIFKLYEVPVSISIGFFVALEVILMCYGVIAINLFKYIDQERDPLEEFLEDA
jgi:hypothetical protein